MTTAESIAAPDATPEELELRRVEVTDGASLSSIAAQCRCDPSAIVALLPFMVDDSFVTVLCSSATPVRSRELLIWLRAAVVRQMRAPEVLLSLQVSQPRHTVYIDARLIDHQEVVFCVDPPHGYALTEPEALRAALQAHTISLPS